MAVDFPLLEISERNGAGEKRAGAAGVCLAILTGKRQCNSGKGEGIAAFGPDTRRPLRRKQKKEREAIMAGLEIRERFVASTLVARELLRNAESCTPPKPLSTLQIVELTYLAHGWSFVNLEAPLVSDDVYAWQHGPVYPELYEMIRQFRSTRVTKVPASPRERRADIELAERERSLVEAVYDRYKEFSGFDLMKLTGEPGTPWHATWQFSQDGVIIGNDLIRDYYVQKARRESNA